MKLRGFYKSAAAGGASLATLDLPHPELARVWKTCYYQKVEYLVFVTTRESTATFIVLPRISHTKVWEIGVGSEQKCGKT